MEREVVQTEADRYVIVEYLAEGGMGAIFLGKKVGLEGFEKEVVLKQLLPEFTSQPEFIDLFLREAKLSASLDHANIVHTIDLVAAGEDYFIVMEYVRGADLRALLRRIKQRGHSLHPAAAMFIARETLSALAYAHEKRGPDGQPLKLIHRDISPSNIMVSVSGEVKLTDFGIAKVSTHKSVFYRVKGKVGYMSPEQAYGNRPLDARSDLYSLGVCLHEMLSGERLFIADLLSTPDQIYSQGIPALEGLPGIPRGIDQVLATALAFEPDERYQTALDLQDALTRVAYDNAMLFGSPELASHLIQVCGDDPARWNREEESERPGTEVLEGGESEHFSGIALTSIFPELDEPPKPAPAAPRQLASETSDEDLEASEATKHVAAAHVAAAHVATSGLAYAPTWLLEETPDTAGAPAVKPALGHYDAGVAAAFPEDDEGQLDAEPTVARYAENESPLLATGQLDAEPTVARYADSKNPLAVNSALESIELEPWRVSRMAESRLPTLDLEPSALVEAGESKLVRYPSRPASLPRALPPAASRREHSTRGEPGAGGMPVARTPVPEPADPPRQTFDTQSVAAPHLEQRGLASMAQRHRLLLLFAVVLLLLSGGAIVLLVGLTGPEFEDLPEGNTKPGAPGPSPRPVPPPTHPLPERQSPRRPKGTASSASPQPTRLASSSERSLRVQSMPARARVYVEDVFQCVTPCTIEELGTEQVYLVSVRQKHYVSWSSLVDMQHRQRVQLTANLVEEPDSRTVGYVTVRSSPPAMILINGKEIGRVTSEGRVPLPPGEYEITLSHPRRSNLVQLHVKVRARQAVVLRAKLEQ